MNNLKRSFQISFATLICMLLFAQIQQASAYYDPGVQRWINRDPIKERGGRNLYRFVKNAPSRFIDPFGRSILDYIPGIATVRCCMTQPGESVQDYSDIKVDLKKCRQDPETAEDACETAIANRSKKFITDASSTAVPKLIVDLMISSVGLLPHPVTRAAGALLILDGFIGAACAIDSITDIGNAAATATANQCKCPES